MNDQQQQSDGPQSTYGPPLDQGPVADPDVAARVEHLEDVLHGAIEDQAPQEFNWSGVDETDTVFASLAKVLDPSIPPNRPTSDLPGAYGSTKQGS